MSIIQWVWANSWNDGFDFFSKSNALPSTRRCCYTHYHKCCKCDMAFAQSVQCFHDLLTPYEFRGQPGFQPLNYTDGEFTLATFGDQVGPFFIDKQHHIDGLVQERRNSSALAMGLLLSCTKPSIYTRLQLPYDCCTNMFPFRYGSYHSHVESLRTGVSALTQTIGVLFNKFGMGWNLRKIERCRSMWRPHGSHILMGSLEGKKPQSASIGLVQVVLALTHRYWHWFNSTWIVDI